MKKKIIYFAIASTLTLCACNKKSNTETQSQGDVYISVKIENNVTKYALGAFAEANYIINKSKFIDSEGKEYILKEYGKSGTVFKYTSDKYSTSKPKSGNYKFEINIKDEGNQLKTNSLSEEIIEPSKINLAEIRNSNGYKRLYINFNQLTKATKYKVELFDDKDNLLFISPLLSPVYDSDNKLKENTSISINEAKEIDENNISRTGWLNSSYKLYSIKKVRIYSYLKEENSDLTQSISECEYLISE
ncbi:hypothetical protein E0494_03855 [Marinilabiliaceae bacterium JC040]|nr:hypothetical protein [Marinilabiliaceae bacterium JC040]